MAKKSVKIQTGNTSENVHLQCQHNVSDVNRTVHILADYFSIPVVTIRKRTKDFAKLHIAWVEQIGYDIYSHIKKTPMDYVDSIDKAKTPFDELTITIFARMMRIHIGIVMKTYHWTTSSCLELAICDIVLGYAGPRRTENRDGVYLSTGSSAGVLIIYLMVASLAMFSFKIISFLWAPIGGAVLLLGPW